MIGKKRKKGLFVFCDTTKESNQVIKFKVSSHREIQDLIEQFFYPSVYLVYFFLSSEEKKPTSFTITSNSDAIKNIVFLMSSIKKEYNLKSDFTIFIVDCGDFKKASMMMNEVSQTYSM